MQLDRSMMSENPNRLLQVHNDDSSSPRSSRSSLEADDADSHNGLNISSQYDFPTVSAGRRLQVIQLKTLSLSIYIYIATWFAHILKKIRKSWNLKLKFSRPGKVCKMIIVCKKPGKDKIPENYEAVAQRIAFRVVSICWQGDDPFPCNLGSNWPTPSWRQRVLTYFAL